MLKNRRVRVEVTRITVTGKVNRHGYPIDALYTLACGHQQHSGPLHGLQILRPGRKSRFTYTADAAGASLRLLTAGPAGPATAGHT